MILPIENIFDVQNFSRLEVLLPFQASQRIDSGVLLNLNYPTFKL